MDILPAVNTTHYMGVVRSVEELKENVYALPAVSSDG